MFRLARATPASAQIKTTTATLTIIDNEGPGTLDFSSSAYTVLEGAGFATVTVNRLGASNLALSVNYATQTAVTNPATPDLRLHGDLSGADPHVQPRRDLKDLPGSDSRRLACKSLPRS